MIIAAKSNNFTFNIIDDLSVWESSLFETATIQATSLTANADNDFNNYGANITTTGNLNITAGDDINIGTVAIRNRTEEHWGNKKKGGNTISDVTTNQQSNITSNNINLTTIGEDTSNIVITAANITANDININSNNTYLLSATNTNFFQEKTHNKKTFTSKNNDRGHNINTIIDNNFNGNININSNHILAQYNKNNHSYINNITNNPSNITTQELTNYYNSWNETNRGLTGIAQATISAAAIAIAIATGGIGSGVSGAMITAAATTTGATATISATQAGMNSDGDMWKQTKDISKIAWDDTTSRESLENYAIATGVAGASAWAVQASGGTTSLEKGKDYAVYKPHEKLIENNPDLYTNYNGIIDPKANNIGIANTTRDITKVGQPVPPYSKNPFTKSFWQGFNKESGFMSNNANQVGGMNSMSLSHDPWSQNAIIQKIPGATQLTIPPAITMQYCATFPAACVVAINKDNLINEQ